MRPTGIGCAWCDLARRGGPLLLLAALVGCGSGTGTVSGRVLVGKAKEPLPGGLVTFAPVDSKHNVVTAEIDEQGHYEATVPAGEVRISVDNRSLMPPAASPPPSLPPELLKLKKLPPPTKVEAPAPAGGVKASGRYRKIPEKYYRTDQSGLTFTVTGGAQKHDIELK